MRLHESTEGSVILYDDLQDEFILTVTKGDLSGQTFYGSTSDAAFEQYAEALRVNWEHRRKDTLGVGEPVCDIAEEHGD